MFSGDNKTLTWIIIIVLAYLFFSKKGIKLFDFK